MENNNLRTSGYTSIPGSLYPQINTVPAAENPYMPVQYTQRKQISKFKPDAADFVFALLTFILGYMFSRWLLFTWQGWGVAVFTTAYLLIITAYMLKKGVYVKNVPSWFWFGITLATGISYALWENRGIIGLREMLLFCSAVYYVIVASNRTIMGKTSNALLLDGINTICIIPFRNFINQYLSFAVLKRKKENRGKRLPIFLGIMFGLVLLLCLVPLLLRADSGGFAVIVDFFTGLVKIDINLLVEILFYSVFAVPIAAYIYGLVSGAAHKRGTDTIKQESTVKAATAMRCFQPATVFIALGTVCGLYLIFILCQIPYFFSAFTGRRPEGWLIYAEYARHGFFELCGIAAINLLIITIGNTTCRKKRIESRVLKSFNIAIAIITLVLIATAMSKMALYIDAYGLTMPRLLPCVFMVLMAVVFIALIVLQKWEFSIVRFSLVVGCVGICTLCLSNPDAIVVRYNTERFIAGTLVNFDTEILKRSGSAGVDSATKIYEMTSDEQLKTAIAAYLDMQSFSIENGYGMGLGRSENGYNYEMYHAREILKLGEW